MKGGKEELGSCQGRLINLINSTQNCTNIHSSLYIPYTVYIVHGTSEYTGTYVTYPVHFLDILVPVGQIMGVVQGLVRRWAPPSLGGAVPRSHDQSGVCVDLGKLQNRRTTLCVGH